MTWSYAFLNLRSANNRQMSDGDGRDHRKTMNSQEDKLYTLGQQKH